MKRIVLSVTNDLVADQRVHRSCMALNEEGYSVTLVGRKLPDSKPVSRPYKTERMRLLFRKKAVFYAEYNIRLFLKLLFKKADLFYANDTDTLLANYCAARLRCKPLYFDAHELFPEVPELVGRPSVKRFWTKIEDAIFPHLKHCSTVCQSIADIYKERYGIEMHIVRNVPDRLVQPSTHPNANATDHTPIILYQGAVNVGRGIAEMIEAMPYLDGFRMIVAGGGDCVEQIRTLVQRLHLEDRVELLGPLPFSELKALTPKADIGLSILNNMGFNYYYSLPNRIADFVQAEVPVLATDFPEIHRVVAKYQIGTLIPSGVESDPQQLAQIVKQTYEEWTSLDAAERTARFQRAGEDLCWDNDKKILKQAIRDCFRVSSNN